MLPPPVNVPVCLVTGAAGADRHAFLLALAAARPAGERWAMLVNDAADLGSIADPQLAVDTSGGCACCTGQVALQTGIARLIRRSRPQRLIIAAAAAAEPAALERILQQPHLARGTHVGHRLCVAEPQLLVTLPQSARDLLLRQMAAADQVVCRDAPAVAALRASGARRIIQFAEAIRLVLGSPGPSSGAGARPQSAKPCAD